MADYETLSLTRFAGNGARTLGDSSINWQLRALEAEAALHRLSAWTSSADETPPIDGGLGGKLPWLIYGLAVGAIIGLLL